MPHNIREDDNIKFLIEAILELRSLDEGYDFFEDLCTMTELKSMSQRLVVAKMLRDKRVYSEIVKDTGASTATISRVNRSLIYGCNGYEEIFNRLAKKSEE
ncbi:MAG: TrpR-like protein, YerC/YecD [Clostridia bacterium]|nr:TrpR-like protein, YerC/YecD [Clostridia bacterium]